MPARLISTQNIKIYEESAGTYGTFRFTVIDNIVSKVEFIKIIPANPNPSIINTFESNDINYMKAVYKALASMFSTLDITP